jgi:hypothetical protein
VVCEGCTMRHEGSSAEVRRWVSAVVMLAGAVAVIVVLVVVVPPLFAPDDRFSVAADAIKAQNDVRVALLQSIAGVGVLVGVYFTWRQLAETRRQAEQTSAATRAQLGMAVQQQVNERLANAVEQLGHQNPSVQIAGVSVLELIARDQPDLRDLIAQILVAHIRQLTPWLPATADTGSGEFDYLATRAPAAEWALVALGRTVVTGRWPKRLRLNMLDLRGANLEGLQFSGVDLAHSHLEEAFLRNTDLTDAWLVGANLRRADFRDASLSGARVMRADLSDARNLDASVLTEMMGDDSTVWPEAGICR